MEEPPESLDGSSIKPVSSLRSHFEQMANAKPSNNTTPRAVSPNPNITPNLGINKIERNITGRQEFSKSPVDIPHGARGREREWEEHGLKPFRNISSNPSPSPTRHLSVRNGSVTPACPPAVTIQPPQSPPKVKAPSLSLASASAYLSTDAPFSAGPSSASSPRHFRIPSRPNTPLYIPLDPGRSPSLPASRPPSPPPPRRSGEIRRDSFKPLPPPVNRAEKPKIGNKPIALGFKAEATALAPVSPMRKDKSSPFSTPPDSRASPEHELVAPIPRPRKIESDRTTIPATQRVFEPPPIHHAVVSRRKDQESGGIGRGLVFPQAAGDQRPPALPPNRPQVVAEPSTHRQLNQNSMMPPPPPRPSVDRQRPAVITAPAEEAKTFDTPPKRVFSTPTSQLQTPPRTHGRSMTVDRTSNRTPAEFRTPPVTHFESRQSLDIGSTSSYTNQAAPTVTEYPDPSNSNRRAPHFKQHAQEISTKYDTRLIDICGEFVCTSGHQTRVWSLLDGEVIMNLPHTEGLKIVSVSFKPTADVKDEGTRLWLGNNVGELMEVDVTSQSVLVSKANVHTRREVIRIYRHRNQMWTLDDGGTLHLWGPDSTGIPQLTSPTQSFRVSKGHTFSMVIGGELWHAAGKDIRIFMPTLDGATQFQVLTRPLNQPNTGDITSGCAIATQPDRVYFGHTDGKVSIYSRLDFSCIGVVNVSVYKITTLAGEGGKLWVGFSTGMVYIYDTTKTPWQVKKDWKAHNDPVIRLLADNSSFWSLDRAQVVSLGQDNAVRVWDGLLQEDWMETQMHSHEASFCDFNQMQALVMTWNAGASTPFHLQHSDKDSTFFRDLLQGSDNPDILVFGFQELVDLEDKTRTAKSFFKSKKKDPHSEQEHMSHQYRDWRDFLTRCIDDYMPRSELYHLVHTSHLVGLFTCIFVKAPFRDRIRSVCGADVKRGMGGLHGNKGALVVRFVLDNTSLCFINCHLAAGQSQTRDRNNDITAILESAILPVERDRGIRQDSYTGGGDGSMIMDHEICILNGDLNYRIDTMGRDTVVTAVKANNLSKLLERDQLLASKRKNPWFKLRAFDELPITFAPTYKYDVGTDNYDTSEKKRSPAWCDRILSRGQDRIRQIDYRRHEVRVSDHRPVTGQFDLITKTISPQKRAVKWDECQNQWLDMKDKHGYEAKLNYLTNILGFDAATSKKLIAKHQKAR